MYIFYMLEIKSWVLHL